MKGFESNEWTGRDDTVVSLEFKTEKLQVELREEKEKYPYTYQAFQLHKIKLKV